MHLPSSVSSLTQGNTYRHDAQLDIAPADAPMTNAGDSPKSSGACSMPTSTAPKLPPPGRGADFTAGCAQQPWINGRSVWRLD